MRKSRVRFILITFLSVTCLIVISYFTVYPWIDRATCYSRISRRIQVDSTYSDIKQYLEASLTPGLMREDVEEIVKALGPIETTSFDEDTILIESKLCSHPFNNMILFADFSKNGRLISVYIEDED